MRKKVLLFSLLLFGATRMYAQDKGEIEGRVKDAQGHPLPGATVRLVDVSDSATGETIQTDTAGRFFFGGLPFGVFACTITHAGTRSMSVDSIPVTPISGTIDLGDLILLPAGKLLTEVVVFGRSPTIRTGARNRCSTRSRATPARSIASGRSSRRWSTRAASSRWAGCTAARS